VAASVISPGLATIVDSAGEEPDTTALDSSSSTSVPADSSLISSDIASNTRGLESVESNPVTTALEMSSKGVSLPGSMFTSTS